MNIAEVLLTAALGGGVALGVALLAASPRRVSLSTRRALLLSALAVAAAAPLISISSTALGFGLRPASLLPAPVPAPAPGSTLSAATPAPSTFSESIASIRAAGTVPAEMTSEPRAVPATPLPWATIVLSVWLIGTVLGFLRIGASLVRLRALRRTLEPSLDARVAGAFTSDALRVPATVGVFAPVVVLPRGFLRDVDDADLAAVLRHERAHVLRKDPLAGLLARFARALHWPNPLVHLAARRLDATCESIADGAAVLEDAALAPRYASCLVRLAERTVAPAAAGVHGIVGGRGFLTRRVEALLDPARRPDPRGSRAGRAAAILLGLTLTIGLACCCRGSRLSPPPCCEKEVHYYPELVFAPAAVPAHSPVKGFSPRSSKPEEPAFTDGMLSVSSDPTYPGKIVVFFETGADLDPASVFIGRDAKLGIDLAVLQVLQYIPGTGNVPLASAPGGVVVRDDRIVFTPARLPLANGQYSVGVFSGLRDRKGAPLLQAPVFHSFTVGSADTIAPVIVTTSPADHAQAVDPTGLEITVRFTEAVGFSGRKTGQVRVTEADGAGGSRVVEPAAGYPRARVEAGGPGGFQVDWRPARPLMGGRRYLVTISGWEDAGGNALANSFSFDFTTVGVAAADEKIRALEAQIAELQKRLEEALGKPAAEKPR